ncbi:MAG: insulinase family protein [Deltaproteobacteria bacterium]|nr:insulinase family protein [Deltaproteobacteria bacterium]
MADYIPEIHQATLSNGLNLLGVEFGRAPWLSLTFMAKRGSETDPAGKPGVADWAAELLTLGTASRNQLQLAQDIEARGASLNGTAGFDAALISLEGLAEDYAEHLATLAEIIRTPSFPEDEFNLIRERRRAELTHQLEDPRELASLRFLRLFFGEAPYGHPAQGDLKSLDALGLPDLQNYYQREITPATSTLVVVGMLDFATVVKEAERLFGSWQGRGPASPAYAAAPDKICAPGIYLLDRPDLTQSEIRVGHLGLPRSHPDYFPLRLANYILGEGGFSSRLMARIRSDLGFTYGIRSSFSFRRAPGPFIVSTFTPAANTAAVVKEIKAVIQEVRDNGVTAQELAEAQSYFVGHFPLGLETSRGIGRQVLSIDLYDLGLDYLKGYCDQIRDVTLETAAQSARNHLHPESLVTLVMGPASQCADALRELGAVQLLDNQ